MFLLVASPLSAIKLRNQPYLTLPIVILVFNLLLVFYVFAVFAPPGSAHSGHNWGLIIAIIIVTILGASIATILLDRLASIHNNIDTAVVRWACVAAVIAIDFYLFKPVAPHIGNMLGNGGWIFLFFVFVTMFTAWRLTKAYKNQKYKTKRGTLLVVGIAVIGAFYYLSVLAFALFVFPYIPATKGGGDFRFGGNVKIVFRTNKDAIAARLWIHKKAGA